MANPNFSSAVVKIQIDSEGNLLEDWAKILKVTDQAELDLILRYLPGVGTGRRSPVAGGWMPGVIIELSPRSGPTIEVLVHPEFKHWTEGNGDWPLESGFRDVLEELVTREKGS